MKNILYIFITVVLFGVLKIANAYPIDGYPKTDIRRLEYYRLSDEGVIKGKKLYEGAKLKSNQVAPRLLGIFGSGLNLPDPDPILSKKLARLIPSQPSNYGIAVLDITNPGNPVYMVHNPDYKKNVGSVGKFLVAIALFSKLEEVYPNDTDKRISVLKNTRFIADKFSIYDHHKIYYFNTETQKVKHTELGVGTEGNLYEFLDWMLSPSSNSAAAMVQKQVILLSHFKERYPVSEQEEKDFFKNTPKTEIGKIFIDSMVTPLQKIGIDTEKLRQGSVFTKRGKQLVPGTNSYGNPSELLKLLYLIEKGQLIDEFSSRELKNLIYLTERRIRYASHPSMYGDAIYFKSGSWYTCHSKPCPKYKGNKKNLLASVAIVESPAINPKYHYLVVIQSNVLRKNSSVAHQTLAIRIKKLIEELHPEKEVEAEINVSVVE